MFKIRNMGGNFYISDGEHHYMHRDGEIVSHAAEYWPTRELAQAVLDKYQPVPKHVWKHGDVFKTLGGSIMMFVKIYDKPARVIYLNDDLNTTCKTQEYLEDATFLSNIMEIMKETMEKFNAR